uniref:Uncharacterized protein n=1 Tax=Panagrolaimus sp. JU765 TaxID=591449 RepID=A0AC34PWL7_9BILA
MKWSVLFVILSVFPKINGNEVLAETFQSIDMRDQALFQLIIGTIAIAVISICIMGFMLIFQCYSTYCTKKLHQKLPLTSSNDEEKLRTVSFRSIFVEEGITHAF